MIKIITTTLLVLLFNNANANGVKQDKVTYTDSTITSTPKERELANTKMQMLDIDAAELERANMLRHIANEMDKNNALSTLEILGINAKTASEKRKYARKFVKAFRAYTAQVLEFQKYINQAHKDLYGSGSMFDYQFNIKSSQQSQTKRSRLKHIVDLNDCYESCEVAAKKAIKLANIFPIDFFFKNANEQSITDWAKKINIKVDDVERGIITLNVFQQ